MPDFEHGKGKPRTPAMSPRWLTAACTSLTSPFRTLVMFLEMFTNRYAGRRKSLPGSLMISSKSLVPTPLSECTRRCRRLNPVPSVNPRKFTHDQGGCQALPKDQSNIMSDLWLLRWERARTPGPRLTNNSFKFSHFFPSRRQKMGSPSEPVAGALLLPRFSPQWLQRDAQGSAL